MTIEELIKEKHNTYVLLLNNISTDNESYKNSKSYLYHQKMLFEELSLMRKLARGDNRLIIYFSIYYYLLWNGYLSINKKFEFNVHEEEDINILGNSIFFGSGVCRNISTHFTEILRALMPKIQTYTIGTCLDSKNAKGIPKSKYIIRNINNYSENNISNFSNQINHAETLIGMDNLWLLDPTNFRVQKLEYDEEYKSTILYDTRTTLMLDEYLFSGMPAEIVNFLENYNLYLSKTRSINLSEKKLISIRNEGIERCLDGKLYIDEFRDNSQYLFKKMAKEKRKILKNKQ